MKITIWRFGLSTRRVGRAWDVFAGHWFLAAVVQVELALQLRGVSDSTALFGAWTALSDLLLLQGSNILVAFAISVPALFLPVRGGWHQSYLGLVTLVNLYVALSTLSVKVFADYFRWSFIDGASAFDAAITSSLWYELDWTLGLNLTLWFFVILFQHRRCIERDSQAVECSSPRTFWQWRWQVPTVAGLMLVLDGSVLTPGEQTALASHPVLTFAADLVHSAEPAQRTGLPTASANGMIDPPADSVDIDERLGNLESGAKTLPRPINIILIVLESVGALQLLDASGKPRSEIAPVLAQVATKGIIFDTLYTVFPGTVRSHIALQTGGHAMTWGSVGHELHYPFAGPSLARELVNHGYDTALFSSQNLSFENMRAFYSHLGFGKLFDFESVADTDAAGYRLNSWGGREEFTVAAMTDWLSKRSTLNRPFFITYLTVATHHPYTTPDDFFAVPQADDRKSKFDYALRYSDQVIGVLFEALRRLRLDERTVIAITGDHGEAFGDRHANNFTHKNQIYEENVRSFLILHHPKWAGSAVVSKRIGSLGDIMPTLLAIAGAAPPSVPGQNLLAREYVEKPRYFFKNTYPDKWGVRHGPWKLIFEPRSGATQLFDLRQDPGEIRNLADDYSAVADTYRQLSGAWYERSNDRFVAQLQGYQYAGGRGLRAEEMSSPGPKILAFGTQVNVDKDRVEFRELPAVNPVENVVVWTKWVGYPADRTINFKWVSPSGRVHAFDFVVRQDWTTTEVRYGGPFPMEQGTWKLELSEGSVRLAAAHFRVDETAPVHQSRLRGPRAVQTVIGEYTERTESKESFTPRVALTVHSRPVARTHWTAGGTTKRVIYRWRRPSGSYDEWWFDVLEGWDETRVKYGGELPLQRGRWQLELIESDTGAPLDRAEFAVN